MQGPLAGTKACKFPNAAGETDPGYDACMVSMHIFFLLYCAHCCMQTVLCVHMEFVLQQARMHACAHIVHAVI